MTGAGVPSPGAVLISACLLGQACRYNGGHSRHDAALALAKTRAVIPVCPEVLGGLVIPRPPAEIRGGDGEAVLAGSARVSDRAGTDVTALFIAGAEAVLALAVKHGAKAAVLKARSPSCGVREIYDGTFSGRRVPGRGVTAALLARNGIELWDEEQLEASTLTCCRDSKG